MRIASRSLVLFISISFALNAAVATAAVDPVLKCESRKILSTGKYAKSIFGCESKAAKKGGPVDSACLSKALEKLGKSYAKADQTGCGGAQAIAQVLVLSSEESVAEEVTAPAAGGSADACAAGKLKGAGKYLSSVLTAEAKFLLKPDPTQLESKRARAKEKLAKAFVRADDKSACERKRNVANVREGEDAVISKLLACITTPTCESIVENIATGGSATTDIENDGATPVDLIEVTVTSPNAGEIAIGEVEPGGLPDDVLTVLGREIVITAPDATADDPLVVDLDIEPTVLTDGSGIGGVEILRNGTPITDCTGTPGQADPDPCISGRTTSGNGDARITVLTSAASVWTAIAPSIVCSDTLVMQWETIADLPGRLTQTSLSTGWTGLGHDRDPADGGLLAIGLWCHAFPPATTDCSQCEVTGIRTEDGNCRCANDNRQFCDEPLQADADDCGGDICECYTSPPLSITVAAVPQCLLPRLNSDLTGDWVPIDGRGSVSFDEKVRSYLGQSQIQPCPVCVGDLTPRDGVRNGVCNGGANDQQSCDADVGISTAPFATSGEPSLDCVPDPLLNITGTGTRTRRTESTESSSLSATLSCDAPLGFLNCLCPSVCSGDGQLACNTDSDCSVVGAGTCDASEGASSQPNACIDGSCDTSSATDGSGVCDTGPVDSYCDGFVNADGTGLIPCLADKDCVEESVGVAAGSCTLAMPRKCFGASLNPMGQPDPLLPLTVSTYCMAPTFSAAIDASYGLPGPVLSKTERRISYFISDCMDSDGDGFADQACGGADCFDGNDQAFPGQTGTFSQDRGDGSYDYDCDGDEDEGLICGDGIVQADEQCDTGGNSFSCDADCTFAICGDGFVNPARSEQCDDGDLVNSDACRSNCFWARCGDGFRCSDSIGEDACANSPFLIGAEQCDDGNLVGGDGCEANCTISQCTPNCAGRNCGTDGCLGSCGTCGSGTTCVGGTCQCVPDCVGKVCGDDGCGGSCGTCSESCCPDQTACCVG